ncbi:hypothetical protein ACWEF6_02740 [Amycolatopsis sp. NPDC004772]
MDDPVEQAARAEFDKVRADPQWHGRSIEHLYSEALPTMVAAAVRAALAEETSAVRLGARAMSARRLGIRRPTLGVEGVDWIPDAEGRPVLVPHPPGVDA